MPYTHPYDRLPVSSGNGQARLFQRIEFTDVARDSGQGVA
ncbi:hypothetical protein SFR_3268 [Streptomyces sp. FR-008]|nr:hypothetical protein SFR_3268 [Streptomyces sp. FR-008]